MRLVTDQAEKTVISADKKVVFQLHCDKGITTVACGVYTNQVYRSFGEVTKNRAKHKRRMPDIARPDLMADIYDTQARIYTDYFSFDGGHIMITFTRIR